MCCKKKKKKKKKKGNKKTVFASPLGALAHGLKGTALLENRFLFVVEPIWKTLFVAVIVTTKRLHIPSL